MGIKSRSPEHETSLREEMVHSQHRDVDVFLSGEVDDGQTRERTVAWLRLLWVQRSFLFQGCCLRTSSIDPNRVFDSQPIYVRDAA